jgi:two-component system CheB/CheR fusion protein
VQLSARNKLESTILYIDVDRFKAINDELGHEAGDILLCEMAARMKSTVRVSDTVARLGGDEFAILLEDITKADSHYVSQKLLHAIETPFEILDCFVDVSISIGMTRFPNHTNDVNQLLQQADQALYSAKKDGKRTYRKYNVELQKKHERIRWIEKEVEKAIKNEEMIPFYQPQYCLKTGELSGFESLARWKHAEEGYITPFEFVPVVEKLALMSKMTKFMITKSIAEFIQLKQKFPKSRLAINVSASDCMSDKLVTSIEKIIAENSLSPNDLELEVTEAVFMQDVEKAAEVLGALHNLGVHIAIDDFGTGFSSLSYLAELPIDTLKIDMQFVAGIGQSPQKESVIQIIIDLAKRIGFETIGEGVENQQQEDFLRENGCDYMQGYFHSKPLPLNECLELSPQIATNKLELK